MSPQSDKDIGIRPRNQSRNVALYKHFEKGAVLRYPLGLCPRHSGRYRRGVSALPAPASAPGHPEGERPSKTPTDAHKGGRIADENRSRAPKRRRLRSVTSSASSPAFDRVRQKPSCAFAHVCLRRSASISDASTVLTAVQLEAARDHCDRSRPLRRHRMFCVKYATITRRLFRPRRSQPICLCQIVNSSQDDSGCGGNAGDPRWARKAGDGKCGGPSKQS